MVKTALLNAVDDVALERGWLFVDETATTGLMGRLDEHVSHMLEERRPRPKRGLTGINLSASFGGVSTELTPELSAGLRRKLNALLDDLERHDSGLLLTIDEVHDALVATFGYPFLIQLVGYQVWRAADGGVAGLEAVDAGFSAARRRLGSLVHETALGDLSDLDRTFLVAMSVDDGPSQMADVRRRMGEVSPQHANTYRRRLMAAGMNEQVSHGKVTFALPYLRDFLREHGAANGVGPDDLRPEYRSQDYGQSGHCAVMARWREWSPGRHPSSSPV